MKNKILMLMMVAQVALCVGVKAQSVGISGSTTFTPNTSAMLDISSSSLGLLIPRTSYSTKIAITSPAKGLLFYDTTYNSLDANIGTAVIPVWSSMWGTAGNSLNSSYSQFLGTSNNTSLRFRANNFENMVIDSATGNVGITAGQTLNQHVATPTSSLQINGSLSTAVSPIVTTTGSSITSSYNLVLVNIAGAAGTILLPTTSGISGRIYTIKNITAGTTITITAVTGQNIDIANTLQLASTTAILKFATIQTDGTNWYIIANN